MWASFFQLYSQSVNFKRRRRGAAPKSTRLNRAMLKLPRLKIGEQAPGLTLEATEGTKTKHTIYLQICIMLMMYNHLVGTYQPY